MLETGGKRFHTRRCCFYSTHAFASLTSALLQAQCLYNPWVSETEETQQTVGNGAACGRGKAWRSHLLSGARCWLAGPEAELSGPAPYGMVWHEDARGPGAQCAAVAG